MILAQWVTSPGFRHQNPGQVRMILEHDAEHVPYFALIPVGRWPDTCSGVQRQAVTLYWYFDSDIFIAIEGQKMVDNREIAFGLALAILPGPFVNGGQVVKHPVRPWNFVFEMA